jgi:hypothetical protein
VQFEHLVWPQTGNGQDLQNPLWDFFAHAFERWVASRRVDAFDDAGDGIADPGNFLQAILGD